MAEKSLYNYRVEPQEVDFTLRATLASLGSSILNTAGVDAYGKGFGVDVLNADNHSWVLSRMAIEIDRRPETVYGLYGGDVDQRLRPGAVDPKLHADRRCGLRIRTRRDTVGDDRPDDAFGRGPLVGGGREHEEAVVPVPPPAAMPRKIRSVTPTQRTEHRVVYSDIDVNRHVNTMRYIELMLDMLPVELLTCEAPVRLDIHFLKECRFGQTLTVGCELRDRSALFGSRPTVLRQRSVPVWSGRRTGPEPSASGSPPGLSRSAGRPKHPGRDGVRRIEGREVCWCGLRGDNLYQTMKITIVGPAHPYRGRFGIDSGDLARTFQRRGAEVGIRTFTLQYPSLLFPGRARR